MCMLSYIPAGVKPDEEGLLNGGISNPHGSGWALITKDDEILVGKSMKVEEALDEFLTVRDKNMEGAALFHSRWATHGSTNLDNVHPFPVGGSMKTVVGHNGILRCTPAKGDDRSDTRLFADEILPTRYRRLDKPRAFEALESYAGSNKLVILTVDPRYRHYAYIVNEQLGVWDSFTGNWHSNHDYLGHASYYGTSAYGKPIASRKEPVVYEWTAEGNYVERSTVGYDPQAMCDFCRGYVSTSGYCTSCGACMDCYETAADCQCYEAWAARAYWGGEAGMA